MAENCAPLLCDKCRHGKHHQCWGHVGPMTTHPDSLPLCTCGHRAGSPGGGLRITPGQPFRPAGELDQPQYDIRPMLTSAKEAI